MIWDQRYATPDYVYGTEPNEFLAKTVRGLSAGGRALCLAERALTGRPVWLLGAFPVVSDGRTRFHEHPRCPNPFVPEGALPVFRLSTLCPNW